MRSILVCGACIALASPAVAQVAQTYRYDGNGRLVSTATAYPAASSISTYAYDDADNRDGRGQYAMGFPPTAGQLSSGYNLLPTMRVTSPNGSYIFRLNRDGNVTFGTTSIGVWESQTANGRGLYLQMQVDGNLVLYDSTYAAVWASGTSGNTGAYLVVGNDGKARIRPASGTGADLWCQPAGAGC